MTKPKIVAYNRVRDKAIDKLNKKCEIRHFKHDEPLSDPSLREALSEAEGFIGLGMTIDKEFLDLAPKLKVVSNVSVGHSNMDIEELTKRGIAATNTPGVLDDTTADAIFGVLIATARRIPELDHYVKSGGWKETLPDEKFGMDVHHKKLGIIGAGRIGQAIAKRAHFGFDMDILYYNRSRKPEFEKVQNASYRSLEELLQEADYVCLMTPLTPETKHLMGAEQFKLMKKSAIFINGSRGSTVDEEALIEALNTGEIRAAGLDVFKEEPLPEDHPFLKMEQVVTTPHIGSSTDETEDAMSLLAAENVEAALDGKRPPSLLNEEVFEK